RRTRCSVSISKALTSSIPCCFRRVSRAIRCARILCSFPGSPSPGRVRRNRASPITRRLQVVAACCHPAFPTPSRGDPEPQGRRPLIRWPRRKRRLPGPGAPLERLLNRPRPALPTELVMTDALDIGLRIVVVIGAFLLLPLLVGQTEHKVMAHMQSRVGPMYAGGFHGWAQLVADGVKFVQKEAVIPAGADQPVFAMAPGVALVPYLVAMIAIPIGPGLIGQDLDLGLFFVLAVMSIGVLGSLGAVGSGAKRLACLG